MDIQKLELHDAIISNIEVNLGSISVLLKCYLHEGSDKRIDLRINFSGVRSCGVSMDHVSLENNARSGNVNYWIPKNNGTTYIYLMDGCINIDSKNICVSLLDGDGVKK